MSTGGVSWRVVVEKLRMEVDKVGGRLLGILMGP